MAQQRAGEAGGRGGVDGREAAVAQHHAARGAVVGGQDHWRAAATIRWGTDYDVGIDNIRFTVVRDPGVPLPLPGTLALAALACAAVAVVSRRRRERGGDRA